MAAQKDAVVVCLDVSPSMSVSEPGTVSPLHLAVKVVNMLVQQRLYSQSKDELALVLLGTGATDNSLALDNGGYDNITTCRALAPADLNLLQFLQDKIVPGHVQADMVDGLVVAMDILARATKDKRYNRRILMLTDGCSPAAEDQLDTILNGMKSLECHLQILGPDLDDEENEDPGPSGRPKTAPQLAGERILRNILQQVGGESISFDNAIEVLSFLKKRQVKQTSQFRGQMEIGPDFKINVWSYLRVKEVKPNSWKKLSAVGQAAAQPGTMKVQMDRSYHLNDEDETEVEKSQLAKGYRFGRTIVPVLDIDEQSMKFTTTKGLKVLGFTTSSNIKIQHRLGDSVVVIVAAPGDEHAAIALSSVIHALAETDKVAIVRFVPRANASPKLGFCFPHIKALYECLMFIELPFMEDLRQFSFPPLCKQVVSTEEASAVDDLITNMDLSRVSNEDGEETEELQSKNMLNPVLLRTFQCIQHRALNPDEPLPPLDPVVAQYLRHAEQVGAQTCAQVQRISKLFKLTPVERKRRHGDEGAASAWQGSDAALDLDASTAKRTDAGVPDMSMEGLAQSSVEEVGTVDPVKDFNALLSRRDQDMSDQAFEQMKSVILKLVRDSFGDELFFKKALDCLRTLRSAAISLSETKMFNDHLREIKAEFLPVGTKSFWQHVLRAGITLISSGECDDSNVSHAEAQQFLKAEEKVDEAPLPVDDSGDVEDLYAEM